MHNNNSSKNRKSLCPPGLWYLSTGPEGAVLCNYRINWLPRSEIECLLVALKQLSNRIHTHTNPHSHIHHTYTLMASLHIHRIFTFSLEFTYSSYIHIFFGVHIFIFYSHIRWHSQIHLLSTNSSLIHIFPCGHIFIAHSLILRYSHINRKFLYSILYTSDIHTRLILSLQV